MARHRQPSLFAALPDQVRAVLCKVRDAGVLEQGELELLERACAGELAERSRVSNWQLVVDTWLAEFQKACNAPCPRPTNTEMAALKKAAARLGAERTCQLIRAFWAWRRSSEWARMVDPTPMGFVKHLAKVVEFEARPRKGAAGPAPVAPGEAEAALAESRRRMEEARARTEARKARQAQQEQDKAQAENDRRRELDAQARQLVARDDGQVMEAVVSDLNGRGEDLEIVDMPSRKDVNAVLRHLAACKDINAVTA